MSFSKDTQTLEFRTYSTSTLQSIADAYAKNNDRDFIDEARYAKIRSELTRRKWAIQKQFDQSSD